MKVIFMGTPDFALPSLDVLLNNNDHQVLAVVTQPDRPAGRGKKMRSSPVKIVAQGAGVPVYQPEKVRNPAFIKTLAQLQPDVIIVAAFGQILPEDILKLPPYGCINVHASLLPAYRGAAPIHRVVMNGEKETGITIMQMDAGLDTGDMVMQEKIDIGKDDTAGIVHDRLATLGGNLLLQALKLMKSGQATLIPQDDEKSTYAPPLTGEDQVINWHDAAHTIKNQIRGLNPWPGAHTVLRDKLLKIWRVDVAKDHVIGHQTKTEPGLVLGVRDEGIFVQTGAGVLVILELQLQGKKRLDVATFLRGNMMIKEGAILGQADGD